ncbi:hypothetical protein GALMADRAFT_1208208 [Galerina marginata CBS 339.88]|uniref:Uncharacterized protein n=1 Tax=Galerina marginata (strain CBS 339.88) TaxID=685588 RepID=A0A067SEP4_GALM3|nr:hypothetical protein GALMADRAFT_1208208 [Galerina marginata CBS 339.88]
MRVPPTRIPVDICAMHGIYTILRPRGAHRQLLEPQRLPRLRPPALGRARKALQKFQTHCRIQSVQRAHRHQTHPLHRLLRRHSQRHPLCRPDHGIFFDSNTFASDFSHFGDAHKKCDHTAYAIHDYSSFGFPGAQEYVTKTRYKVLKDQLDITKRTASAS